MITLFDLATDTKTIDFYPTPPELAEKMLEDVDFSTIKTVLEPSAGKGNLLRELAIAESKGIMIDGHYYSSDKRFDVDCIEIDKNLQQVLKYNFSDEREREIRDKLDNYRYLDRVWNIKLGKYEYPTLSKEEIEKKKELEYENETFFKNGIKIVCDNFLNYHTFKKYDLILMNPPFSNGDEHLLKALDMQKDGGNIICLLNAETIRNPYTNRRKILVQKLNEYGAQIEYVENAFSAAEKPTDVEVAIIKVAIPQKELNSEFLERCVKAEEYEEVKVTAHNELALNDFIEAMIARYKVECRACVQLINEYEALKPYILNNLTETEYAHPVLELKGYGGKDASINGVLKSIRNKYWSHLLHNEKFIGKLTSDLQRRFQSMVDKLCHYEFNTFNIYNLAAEINAMIKSGIEEEILNKFDEMTAEHTYYDGGKNIHYFNGWKTNKAHKIGNKVILPYSVWEQYSYDKTWSIRIWRVSSVLSDIEKVLNYFDGNMTADVDLYSVLRLQCEERKETKDIFLKFFRVTFYKKGTCHIVFNDEAKDLIDRFNIYVCQRKGWLPPSYGKKSYSNLNEEERAVVDSFHGEKAEERYNEIVSRSDYFLASPVKNSETLMLCDGK